MVGNEDVIRNVFSVIRFPGATMYKVFCVIAGLAFLSPLLLLA